MKRGLRVCHRQGLKDVNVATPGEKVFNEGQFSQAKTVIPVPEAVLSKPLLTHNAGDYMDGPFFPA